MENVGSFKDRYFIFVIAKFDKGEFIMQFCLRLIFIKLILLLLICNINAEEFFSPNKENSVMTFKGIDGFLIRRNNKSIFRLQKFLFNKKPLKFFQVNSDADKIVSSRRSPVWGKRKIVENKFTEVIIPVDKQDNIVESITFRIYDEAVAYRLNFEDSYNKGRYEESFETFFFNKMTMTCFAGERSPSAPSVLKKQKRVKFPALFSENFFEPKYFLVLTEAEILDYNSLRTKALSDKAIKSTVRVNLEKQRHSPWRVFMLADRLETLLDSDVISNLNKAADSIGYKWVKPGVSFWDWRAWGHKTADNFTYGLNLESWKRFVDFASEKEIPYLLLDADWYGKEFDPKSNPLDPKQWERIDSLLKYAFDRNVRILLYLNDVASKSFDVDEIFAMYKNKKIAGVKYGFMNARGQEKIAKTKKLIEAAARNKLLIDFHDGPILNAGEEGTYPNAITKEFCHAQSDAKKSFKPHAFLRMAMVNMIAGPLDMNNGLFDLNNSLSRPRIFKQVNSTITAEAARTLITYSGLTVIPDAADVYKTHSDIFKFIAQQKQPWQESKTVVAKFDSYIALARKNSEGKWLLGVSNCAEAQEVNIPLDFLPEGTLKAVIFCDKADTHYINNREAYQKIEKSVSKKDVLKLQLAPGGGACIIFN